MKELNTESKDKVVDIRQVEIEKEVRHDYSFMPQKGHSLWILDTTIPHDGDTDWHADVKKVEPEKDLVLQPEAQHLPGFAVPLKSETTEERTVKNKTGCLYCFALNHKNAVKKFQKKLDALAQKKP